MTVMLVWCGQTPHAVCEQTLEADIKFFDIRIPMLEVPTKKTHYVCQKFKVPDTDTFHAVAFEPLISNLDVMHHMLLFGCAYDVQDMDPHECSGADAQCSSWLAQWTMGVDGKIYTPHNAGVRFGKDSYGYMSLQIHWNNEMSAANLTDNSGMRVYYTNRLRQYDVGNVQIGQQDLDIPPHTIHNESGGCSGTCTAAMLPHPVYLTRTYIHMHYLGIHGLLEVYRNGRFLKRVAYDAEYDYKNSPIHVHDPPIEIRPGDELRLTCTFDSLTGARKRNHSLYFGEGSDAEMCYAFVTYFPNVPNFDQCLQFDEYDMNCMDQTKPFMGGCEFRKFQEDLQSHLIEDIKTNCSTTQDQFPCDRQCATSVTQLSNQPCLQGRLGSYSKRTILSRMPGWTDISHVVDHFTEMCN
ncbi:dopamine beta-hydroxylase-like isoform X1 [Pecten maximus]|uniref:dopamine beta-hydroxylase-like isoform X1 n=1 Tax=Pecten maximus TaxID=6579 RepID=UPI001458B656|nr:dopamine beta-hydroxylase-like isoform X1 [Pecten maximus]